MDKNDDVVVGAITGYDFPTIAPWVNSLDRCGFTGKKVMICYNIKKDVVDELTKRNYVVLGFNQNDSGDLFYKDSFSIVVERFFHLWALLKNLKGQHRYLLHTDVKDVIFQKNPSEYMDLVMNSTGDIRIMASSESIRYKDENWGRENLRHSYGDLIYDHHKENIIVNAGTLSGDFDTMIDFFMNVYMVSAGGRTHNPDQAAVNILLATKGYSQITHVSNQWEAWACQAGTTNDPNKMAEYKPLLVGVDPKNLPFMQYEDGIVYNGTADAFTLVHQYDRVPAWREAILKKYGV